MNIKINETTDIDLSTLIDTRLLVQANSGGGKSWLLRRILEQSHGKVQQIILDLEGEFSTLREKYDYILAGKEGDVSVDIKSAGLLAKRILELNVSAIIDLYELNHQERKEFVRRFLTSMVNAPKTLWHPCMVVIDEAHVFCPEKGQSVASEAVIDLMTRGRKRGYSGILATQRLSKLHKDAAAEANNKLIGRTGLDVDMKRASEELGFTGKEQYLSLRTLEAGEFFAFGPAISKEVIKLTVGPVETTHPKAGARILTRTVPASDKIKAVLGKLSDLPQEARQEEETLESLKKEAFNLRQELLQLKKNQGTQKPGPSVVTEEMLKKALQPHIIAMDSERNAWNIQIDQWEEYANTLKQLVTDVARIITDRVDRLSVPSKEPGARYAPNWRTEAVKPPKHTPPLLKDALENPVTTGEGTFDHKFTVTDDKPLGVGERKILTAIAQSREGITRQHLTVLTGYKRSSRDTYLQRLRQRNYIELNGDKFVATMDGIAILGNSFEPLPTGEELQGHLLATLPEGEKQILLRLLDAYPEPVDRETLSIETGYKRSSRDTYIQRLNARDLIVVEGKGQIKASKNLFV